MTVFTVVPSSVMTQGTMRVLTVLIGIYLFVAVVAVVLSIYFSKRFTSPIREISEEMTQFDGNDFSRLIELNTNTELDQIGHSYNKMLKNIENLLAEINERGTTVLVVTHNKEIVNSMKKRVVTMHEGVIVSDEKEGGYHEA